MTDSYYPRFIKTDHRETVLQIDSLGVVTIKKKQRQVKMIGTLYKDFFSHIVIYKTFCAEVCANNTFGFCWELINSKKPALIKVMFSGKTYTIGINKFFNNIDHYNRRKGIDKKAFISIDKFCERGSNRCVVYSEGK